MAKRKSKQQMNVETLKQDGFYFIELRDKQKLNLAKVRLLDQKLYTPDVLLLNGIHYWLVVEIPKGVSLLKVEGENAYVMAVDTERCVLSDFKPMPVITDDADYIECPEYLSEDIIDTSTWRMGKIDYQAVCYRIRERLERIVADSNFYLLNGGNPIADKDQVVALSAKMAYTRALDVVKRIIDGAEKVE
ncbi:MAG: hypothetical protein NC218_01945 [Acetobacter sp.]|nr:hypothetical protein [Acetobacter sp.]